MRRLESVILKSAEATRVPAGGALAVDREGFSQMVTELVTNHPLIEVIREEITEIPNDDITVIATGPLTSDALAEKSTRSMEVTVFISTTQQRQSSMSIPLI